MRGALGAISLLNRCSRFLHRATVTQESRQWHAPQDQMRGTAHISFLRSLSSIAVVQPDCDIEPPVDGKELLRKQSTLNFAISQLASDFDRESNLSLSRFFCTRRTSVISTGSLKLDMALGIGGLPKGRIVEIFGKEASGKTTLALHVIKEAQNSGGYCAFVDVENALDASYAEAIGIDTKNLLVSRPGCAEESLSIVNTLISSDSVDVIVLDSVAALLPKCEVASVVDMDTKDVQARLMTQALRKIQYTLCRSWTLVIFLNQVRWSGKNGGDSERSCGGNALRFYAAVRLRTSRRALLRNEEVSGIGISVEVVKNKLAPTNKRASLDIVFGRGVPRENEILEIASNHGLILREDSGYWIEGKFFKDHTEAKHFLSENKSVADKIVKSIRSDLFA